jgi:tetratricopeptide (TPR) repeat protein
MKILLSALLFLLFSFVFSQSQGIQLSYTESSSVIDTASVIQLESDIVNIKYSINEYKKGFLTGTSLMLLSFGIKSFLLIASVLPDSVSPMNTSRIPFYSLGVSTIALDLSGLIVYSFSFRKFISPKYSPRQLIVLSNSLNNEGLNALIREDKIMKARGYFKRALKFNPLNTQALNNLGCVKLRNTNHKGAIKQFNKALAIDDSLVEVYFNKGIAHMSLNDMQNACSCWDMAKKLGCEKSADYFKRLCSQ